MLRIDNITCRIGGRVLLEGASAVVPVGHRVGLVGPNGSGKSTLLRLITGEIEPDDGAIKLRRRARIATVAQEAPSGPMSLLEAVVAADRERAELLAEADTATDAHRIAELHTRLFDIDAHSAEARAGAILAGLGFDADAQRRPLDSFSGGWRMRVALAGTLFTEPDLLLLDEPTNYLDLEGTMWLEGYLASYSHTLLVVSHDRDLLNSVANTIVHIDGGKLTSYTGNYDNFVRVRTERLAQQVAERAKIDTQRRHMQAFVDRFRYKASKARQAQSRLKAIARLAPVAAVASGATTVFRFPQPTQLAPPIISLDGTSVGYDDGKPVLSGLDLRIDMDDRIALLGANGNGKSTLVKLLAGRLEPMAGRLTASSKLRIGYFAQHQIDELSPGETAFQHMKRLLPDAGDATVRARVGGFGLVQDKANVDVAKLSGGEKARLLFALMSHAAPHLMLLDEPTNHLDADARDALIQALNDHQGAVVLITHDRHLIETCADRLWLVADGTVAPYDGDIDDYRRQVLSQRRQPRQGPVEDEATAKPPRRNKREARQASARAREDKSALRRAVRDAEALVARLTAEIAKIEASLADPQVYQGPTAALATLAKKRSDIQRRAAKAEEAWLAAQQAIETAAE